MSAEAFVISGIIEEGSAKKALQAGITASDFVLYSDEYEWIISQTERKKTINWRRFQSAFPDFERIVADERLQDLCEELKSEVGFMALVAAIEQVQEEITPDNFAEKADFLREVLADVLRVHSPASDVLLAGDVKNYLKRMKELQIMREAGETVGIPTGIKTLDAHWGGFQGGRIYLGLGRPGDAKSFTLAKFFIHGFLDGRRVAMFSPEMNEDEHRARIGTLISAIPSVQEELGLKKAFRNRALLDGHGYNYKTYKRLWEWINEQPGEMILHTQKYRMRKMTPAYIESKIDDLGIEFVFVDPIYKLKPNERLSRNANGFERLMQVTDELCDIAEMHNIPLVMTNQAHRQMGNKGDAPTKDNSFNSDAPVQEADHVFGVKHISEERKLILRCTKSRFSQDFRVDVRFVPNIGIMEDVGYKAPNYFNGSEDGSEDAVKEAVRDLETEMEYRRT